jgi:DDE superfamily endonuclease/Homeodomain-like domain
MGALARRLVILCGCNTNEGCTMKAKYLIDLTDDERAQLEKLTTSGELGARKLKRALFLLAADNAKPDRTILQTLRVSSSSAFRTRRRFVEGGVDHALNEASRPGPARKTTGKEDATLIALACSKPPPGRCKWTLELLRGEFIRRTGTIVSDETVRRRLADDEVKPWQQRMWCIPKVDADYVAAMEDVLDTYALAPDPDRPLVCFDETPYQMISETRTPLPTVPGIPATHDYEYKRGGTANLFMLVAPHLGWRHVDVTDRHTNADFAAQMRDLVDVHFPSALRIRVVLDNLNTHRPGALYDALPAEDARRIARKLEFHYTPKHGSWLNMAEMEIAVLQGQCLDRRIGDKATLTTEVAAWEVARNASGAKINWRFTVDAARRKFARGYPKHGSGSAVAEAPDPVRSSVATD